MHDSGGIMRLSSEFFSIQYFHVIIILHNRSRVVVEMNTSV